MSDTKISALSAATALAGTEVLPVVQGGATVGATGQQIVTLANGSVGVTGATETASKPLLNHAQTWNNVAVTFTGWKINVTDTTSAAGSLLVDLQVGGTTVFNISKTRGSVLMPQGTSAALANACLYFGTDRASGNPIALNFFNNGLYMLAQGQQAFLVTAVKVALNASQKVAWSSSGTNNDGTIDVAFGRNAAGVIEANTGTAGAYADTIVRSQFVAPSSTNGQSLGLKCLTELTTIAAAATTDTAIQMPANSIVLAVSVRVTTAITCTSTFTVGDSGSATRFGSGLSKAVNTTNAGTVAPYVNASALSVRITPDTVPSDNTGRVRVTIFYYEATVPTS